jgi:hypothetical protein
MPHFLSTDNEGLQQAVTTTAVEVTVDPQTRYVLAGTVDFAVGLTKAGAEAFDYPVIAGVQWPLEIQQDQTSIWVCGQIASGDVNINPWR